MELQEKEFFMREALKEAQKAYDQEEVPIGAVVVLNGEIIGRGHNLREKEQDATLHAEIKAIRQANQYLGSWRLEDCELFVTLEPCPMCSGAMILARMKKVIFGAFDPKAGTAGTFMNLLQDSRFNHQVEVDQGVLEEECQEILRSFFKGLRERNKQRKQEAKQAQLSE
ncbi:tRNA adenosine(34) deaminase TadA [uncultured Granulicatella sp.]|uniref:tRNA adenosine(34) deaminase TadA n=1 Tax=uncultured Granulicatella sp. TaxID=316089 RepID=UPI00261DA809|nr:tRNA adenosine(34) deaminase TadA [uncultured Granulicatella sp.]